jgi:hypothetical protein
MTPLCTYGSHGLPDPRAYWSERRNPDSSWFEQTQAVDHFNLKELPQ